MPNGADTNLADSHPNHDTPPTLDSPAPSRSRRYLLPAFMVLAITLGSLWIVRTLHQQPAPRDLARGLQQPGRRGWQNAYALSQLLLAPEHDHLKDDARLCQALTATLVRQNEKVREAREAHQAPDEELMRFRVFLCHVLGQFRILNGLPVLLECMQAETEGRSSNRRQAPVRRAAIEAIALLAANAGPEDVRAEPDVVAALVAAALANDASLATTPESNRPERDIPSAATFALGVIGGPRATARLLELLDDPRPDVRYNAATGLARHGRSEAISVVLQMLNPASCVAGRDERTESARARKRLIVRSNGIAAAARLVPVVAEDDQKKLIAALEQLRDSQTVEPRIRITAKETLLKLARPFQSAKLDRLGKPAAMASETQTKYTPEERWAVGRAIKKLQVFFAAQPVVYSTFPKTGRRFLQFWDLPTCALFGTLEIGGALARRCSLALHTMPVARRIGLPWKRVRGEGLRPVTKPGFCFQNPCSRGIRVVLLWVLRISRVR